MRRRRAAPGKRVKKPRGPLSTKPTDYQVRIHVIEGRALAVTFSFIHSPFFLSFWKILE